MMLRPSETRAVLSLALVFLCGCALGASVMTYWHHPTMLHTRAATTLNLSVREWDEELGLSPEQSRQLGSILDDFGRYYENLLSDGNTRILQILNPDQRRKFEALLKEHRKLRPAAGE